MELKSCKRDPMAYERGRAKGRAYVEAVVPKVEPAGPAASLSKPVPVLAGKWVLMWGLHSHKPGNTQDRRHQAVCLLKFG